MPHNILAYVIQRFAITFPAFLAVFTFRGFFKAWVAKKMGDDTAYRDGYMTLNPMAHVDVIALSFLLFIALLISGLLDGKVDTWLVYNVLIFMGIRWSYSTGFEPRNFRRLKLGMSLSLLAGPLGCFLLALIGLYLMNYLPYSSMPPNISVSLVGVLSAIVNAGVWFGVFHLLPFPPLDGGRLLQFLLPYSRQKTLTWLESYSLPILLCLFFLPGISHIFRVFVGGICFLVHAGLMKLVF